MIKSELRIQSFGSSYDPILSGIARGLADLYPPIENPGLTAEPNEQMVDFTSEQDEDAG